MKYLLYIITILAGSYLSTNHLTLGMCMSLPAAGLFGWSIMDLLADKLDPSLKKPRPNRLDVD